MPLVKRTEFEIVDPGEYKAELRNIVSKEGKFGFYYQFEFKIIGDTDYEDSIIFGNAPERFAANTKLDGWIAALGVDTSEFETGDTFELEELIGSRCRILVEHTVRKNKAGEQTTFSNVSNILPYKRKKRKDRDVEEEDDKSRRKVHGEEEDDRPPRRRTLKRNRGEEDEDPVEKTVKGKTKHSHKEDDLDF